MALSDDELFDFDHDRLAHFDIAKARRALATEGDVYRAQLVAARFIDGWRQRMADTRRRVTGSHSEDWHQGFDEALRDVVAHLRQGDLIPGGTLHNQEDGESPRRPMQ